MPAKNQSMFAGEGRAVPTLRRSREDEMPVLDSDLPNPTSLGDVGEDRIERKKPVEDVLGASLTSSSNTKRGPAEEAKAACFVKALIARLTLGVLLGMGGW